jgi:hypothetical protein
MGPDQARRNPYAHLLTPCLGLEEPPPSAGAFWPVRS